MTGPHHVWGNEDDDHRKSCQRPGCTIQVKESYRWWRRAPGAKWRFWAKDLIPDCRGGELVTTEGRK
jgi:hypothetical protein